MKFNSGSDPKRRLFRRPKLCDFAVFDGPDLSALRGKKVWD
jgi:hypothetical protein